MNPIIKPARLLANKLQKVLKVLLMDPALDKMDYFSGILAELRELAQFYSRAYPELIESAKQKTARVLYAQGGDCVHRGLLCPSQLLYLILGGDEGRVIPSPEAATENYYKYRFDDENNLISISHYDYNASKDVPNTVEFILRRDNFEYGITFHAGWNEVSNVSKSVFNNGLLENYSMADYNHLTPEEMYLHYEEFTYENDRPIRADVYFGISPELDMFSLDTFYLSYDPAPDFTSSADPSTLGL